MAEVQWRRASGCSLRPAQQWLRGGRRTEAGGGFEKQARTCLGRLDQRGGAVEDQRFRHSRGKGFGALGDFVPECLRDGKRGLGLAGLVDWAPARRTARMAGGQSCRASAGGLIKPLLTARMGGRAVCTVPSTVRARAATAK